MAGAPVIFEDFATRAGLTTWRHTIGTPAKQFIPETDGSGVGLIDYDNDGWLDIYLVNGSTFEAQAGRLPAPKAALFHNNHDGTFSNVADTAGVTNERWGFGVAIGDFDNDGWSDIYVTNLGVNRLYHNNHDGTFTDVALSAGVAVNGWSTGATFGDYDGDGNLDLFVPGYVQYDFAHPPQAGTETTSFHTCEYRSIAVSCGPRGLEGAPDRLFRNNGHGTFTDVSEKSGVSDQRHFYGFTALFADMNNDGKQDLLVANDSTPNYLYVNRGDGRFVDRSIESGFAFNKDGREVASMGLAVGDYLNNGRLGIAITDFSDDYKLLFRNDGDGNFTEVSNQAGIATDTSPFLGWGVGFLDYDNDGWKDLLMLNGHVYPSVDQQPWGISYKQRPLLFHNNLGHGFTQVPAAEHSGLAIVSSARGAAFGDLFNDGQIDVIVNNLDGAPSLLRNVTGARNNWVEVRLVGAPGSPRDAIGTRLELKAGGLTQRADVLSGGSFMSSNDQRAHFGLGKSRSLERLTVYWPSGRTEVITLPEINHIYTITEGRGISKAVPGSPFRATDKAPRTK